MIDTSVIDFPALTIALLIAGVVSAGLLYAHRGENHRRAWIVAAVLAGVLLAIGLVDLLARPRRDTHIATVILGATLPVLGALGMVRGTTRVRTWVRSLMVFGAAVFSLFAGLLAGAAVLPKYLP